MGRVEMHEDATIDAGDEAFTFVCQGAAAVETLAVAGAACCGHAADGCESEESFGDLHS